MAYIFESLVLRDWHHLRDKKVWPWCRCGLVEKCGMAGGHLDSKDQSRPNDTLIFQLPMDFDAELSATMSDCLPPCSMPSR